MNNISDKITQKNDEQNYNKYYKHMSVEDMKGHINGSLMATGAMMADAQVRYRLEGGLESVVDFYDRVMEWVPQFVPKVYAMIEATEDPAERRLNYVRFAINVRLYRTIGATAIDNRAARPVTIAGADSEQELALRCKFTLNI
ncbi:unnamed protein product [Medioppia subpectinata]|uniref:Uncharacterized protein n=1 Tax=Medioppia subpectinata TaxID=1979941 RepID=A0A7R9PU88_9ACAR|nr:unnamed protein product [Medioppia subpectinata]CAG2101316.1 unnamed protein product [Medioppia subpectinata]